MADEETDQFSLRWNNFHSNLTDGFHALLEGEDLVDVTLAAGGKFVQAHKIVLSVCSPYFKELFKVNPCKHPIVILKDVTHNDLVAILQFMYKGEVNVRQEELPAFLKTAETLQIKGLTGGDSASEEQESIAGVQLPSLHVPRTKESTYNRHSVPVASRHIAPSPQSFRPSKRSRLELPSTSTLVPIASPVREKVAPIPVANFVEMHTPKTEPVDDYESDIEVLDSKSEAMIQLLHGDASQSHNEDTDSHQSHYDTTLPQVDTSQSLSTNIQTPMETTLPNLNNTPHGSGMFSEISGTSHNQDVSQDGTQGNDGSYLTSPVNALMTGNWCNLTNVATTPCAGGGGTATLSCTFCDKTFKKLLSLRSHVRNIHGDMRGPFPCHVCGKMFKNMNSLRAHQHDTHKTQQTVDQNKILSNILGLDI